MVFEIAEIEVAQGREAAFEEAVDGAVELFRAAPGCRSMRLERVIEAHSRYRLVVGWDTVEDHTDTFRNSPAFQQWRALAGPFFTLPPKVEHVAIALAGF